MPFSISSKGNWGQTRKVLNALKHDEIFSDLDGYARKGLSALADATPEETGLTANSWDYEIVKNSFGPGIVWFNTNEVAGQPLVILLQYGHGTGTGGFVQGRDFINPAIQPIFDQIADDVWKKVKKL